MEQPRQVALRDDDPPQVRHAIQRADPLRAIGVGDDEPGAAVGKAVAQRVRAEKRGQRNRDESCLVRAKVGDRGRRDLREDDRDAIAGLETKPSERVGHAVGQLAELTERVTPLAVRNVYQRQPARRQRVSAGGADVEARWHPPAKALIDLLVSRARHREGAESSGGRHQPSSARTALAAWYPLPTAPGVPGCAV